MQTPQLKREVYVSNFNWDKYEAHSESKPSVGAFSFDNYEKDNAQPQSFGQQATDIAKDVAVGVFPKLGHELLNLPYHLTQLGKSISDKFPNQKTLAGEMGITPEDIPHQQDYDFGKMVGIKNQTSVDKGVQEIASLLPSLLMPEAKLGSLGNAISSIPKIGKYLTKGLSTALPQSGYAAFESLGEKPEDVLKAGATTGAYTAPVGFLTEMIKSGNPMLRKVARGAIALTTGLGGYELAKDSGHPMAEIPASMLGAYLGHKGINPKRYAERHLLGDVKITPEVQERLDAAKRLELDHFTPAEATNSPFEAAKQGQIGRTKAGSKVLYDAGEARAQSEEKSINKLLDTVYDEKQLDPAKKAAYEKAMSATVPDDFVKSFKNDPLIQDAIKELETDSVYKKGLDGVPKNSFEYWDHVKRILGDLEQSTTRGANPKKYRGSVIGDARREMVQKMDDIMPEYKDARGIAERQFTRQKLEKVFDQKEMTGNNFYNFLKSDKRFNETMSKLKAFPEAQQTLKDMRLIFGDLISNDPSIRTAAAMKKTSMWNPRELVSGIENLLNEKLGSKHDAEAVKLMTSKDWAGKIADLKAPMKREQFISALVNAMGKMGGQYGSKP